MILSRKHIFYLLFLIHIFGLVIYYNSDSLRKIVYVIPLVVFVLWILGLSISGNFRIQKGIYTEIWKRYYSYFFGLFYVLLLQSILAYANRGTINSRLISESIFTFFPLLSVALLAYYMDYTKTRQIVSILFGGIIIAFIAEKGVGGILHFHQVNLAESLISSSFQSESGLAFLIGLFSFYFLFTKKWGLLSISLFFVLISGKRTVLAAVVLCLVIYLVLAVFRIDTKRYRAVLSIVALLANAFVVYLIYLLASGTFDHLIIENVGLPPNSFTKGRYNLWKIIITTYDLSYLGSGLGSISDLLVDQLNYPLHNPLNDVLKIVVEHGFIVFSLWFFIYYFVHSYKREAFVITIYTNVLFLSTNVLIYFFFMFCLYLIHSALITEDVLSQREEKRKKLIKQPA